MSSRSAAYAATDQLLEDLGLHVVAGPVLATAGREADRTVGEGGRGGGGAGEAPEEGHEVVAGRERAVEVERGDHVGPAHGCPSIGAMATTRVQIGSLRNTGRGTWRSADIT